MDNIFTEFRRLKQRLRHLTMIAEQANEGIVVVDSNGINRFVNTAAAKMHGYDTRGELVGKQMNVFYTEEQMKSDVLPLVEEVKRRGQLVGPIEHVRSDGTVFPTETKMTLLKDGRDKAVGLIVFVTDMTERRQAEKSLTNRKLELASAKEMLLQQITERKQAEQSFAQQASELTATNENLRQQVCERRQAEEQLEGHREQLEQRTAELASANEKLQQQITERRQSEQSLTQQASELIATNENLRQQVCERRQTIDQLEQRIAELASANEKLQQQITEHRQAEELFRHQMNEMVAANEQLKQQIAEYKDSEEELLENIIEAETPTKEIPLFNPQEIKALSELAKRLR